MVIYEVNLDIDAAVTEEYLAWLRDHVAEMLTLPGFQNAAIYEVEEQDSDQRGHYCVRYQLRDRSCLDSYFAEHAERMRGDGLARFAGRFRASRRILHPC